MATKKILLPELTLFLEHLAVTEGKSENTVVSYKYDLQSFAQFYAQNIKNLKQEDIRDYLRELDKQEKSAKTQARQLSTLKKFCAFLTKRHILASNPTEGINSPKLGQSLPKALNSQQIEKLFKYTQGEDSAQKRFNLILQLLYGGGLRVTELLTLKLSDIDSEEDTILRITGKGDKTRLVPIGDTTAATLKHYIAEIRPQFSTQKYDVTKSDWLFPSPYKMGQPMTRQRFFQLIRAAGQAANIPELSPHALRHTFATHLVEGSADLRAVQLMLGHANLATTQIYTKVVTDRLRSAIETNHPLAKS